MSAKYILPKIFKSGRWKLELFSWNDTESRVSWPRGGVEWWKREKKGKRGKKDYVYCQLWTTKNYSHVLSRKHDLSVPVFKNPSRHINWKVKVLDWVKIVLRNKLSAGKPVSVAFLIFPYRFHCCQNPVKNGVREKFTYVKVWKNLTITVNSLFAYTSLLRAPR